MNKEQLEEILHYIESHIQEKIRLDDLANLIGYSPFYFSKQFSERMGMPVTSYIRLRKLQYSIPSLLKGTKVLDVSLQYAFESHEGFTRSFRQLFGFPPSKIKKFLTAYEVPKIIIPDYQTRRIFMNHFIPNNLKSNMHQLLFEILSESMKEAEMGYCTKIKIELLENNVIRVTDNGRGLPLSPNQSASREVLDKILAGCPITNLEYSQMGDFSQISLQTVNSFCEMLQVNVCRNNLMFTQDYIRGVAQHNLHFHEYQCNSGTQLTFKPDSEIFGNTTFDSAYIQSWVDKNIQTSILSVILLS